MCSVNEEDLEISNLNLELKTKCNLKDSNCKKCTQEKASVVLRKKDPYCVDCFLKYTTHKFRATLGKSKLVRPNDRILLASSGNQSSAALLHLIADGLSEQNNKRFLFTSVVIHIDEGAIIGLSRNERQESLRLIAKQSRDLGFQFYMAQLSNSLKLDCIKLHEISAMDREIDSDDVYGDDEHLLTLFNAVKTLTSKEDLLTHLRLNLLVAIAKELKCNKILTAENGSQLAVQLITNVSLGRGAHLPMDVGFCDNRDPSVMILRPLKELMSNEISYYCMFNKLNYVTLPSLSTKTSRMASVRRLTEDFLFGLQVDFPSTLSAVIKTGDKLSLPKKGNGNCILCKASLEQRIRECSSQMATKFSRELVKHIGITESAPGECSGQNLINKETKQTIANEELSSARKESKLNVAEYLCYGCRLIVVDMDNADELLESLLPARQNPETKVGETNIKVDQDSSITS